MVKVEKILNFRQKDEVESAIRKFFFMLNGNLSVSLTKDELWAVAEYAWKGFQNVQRR